MNTTALLTTAAFTALVTGWFTGPERTDAVAVVPLAEPDIVDTAVAAGKFETLVAALEAAELVEALRGEGPFTVFAPTDAAFARLPEGTVEMLLKPENRETLKAVLLAHVVAGELPAREVAASGTLTTLSGATLAVRTAEGAVMVGDAMVVGADVEASNGVIHVIDSVILPAE